MLDNIRKLSLKRKDNFWNLFNIGKWRENEATYAEFRAESKDLMPASQWLNLSCASLEKFSEEIFPDVDYKNLLKLKFLSTPLKEY